MGTLVTAEAIVDSSGLGALFVVSSGRDILIIEEDSLAGGLEIVELSAARRPDEGDDAGEGEQQGEGQGDVNDGHKSIMNYEC